MVQDALEITSCFAGSYLSSFTPMTIVMSSFLAGALITTFFAPASRCFAAPSRFVKKPVDSITISTPSSFQGRFRGSRSAKILISLPFTTMAPSLASTLASRVPWTESYLSRCASVFASVRSLIATKSNLESAKALLNTFLPILPKPLIATFIIGASLCFLFVFL